MNAPLLLDTCAALWLVGDEPMSQDAVAAINDAGHRGEPIHVSAITAWEIGLLARKGRFRSAYSPQRWFDRLMGTPGAALAELTPQVLLSSSFLPGDIHNDPADRILAATAREHGYIIVTRDRALLAYGEQGHIRALEC